MPLAFLYTSYVSTGKIERKWVSYCSARTIHTSLLWSRRRFHGCRSFDRVSAWCLGIGQDIMGRTAYCAREGFRADWYLIQQQFAASPLVTTSMKVSETKFILLWIPGLRSVIWLLAFSNIRTYLFVFSLRVHPLFNFCFRHLSAARNNVWLFFS